MRLFTLGLACFTIPSGLLGHGHRTRSRAAFMNGLNGEHLDAVDAVEKLPFRHPDLSLRALIALLVAVTPAAVQVRQGLVSGRHTYTPIASYTSETRPREISADYPRVVDDFTDDVDVELSSAFSNAKVVALDCEGVDLSRKGQICIIQVSTPTQCFLLDVLNKPADNPLVLWLRALLENEGVVKIIHDCRMDSDALFHLLGIKLANVHDTSCWHTAKGYVNKNLNDALSHYGLSQNSARDRSVYRRNPKFWAMRPLTSQMVEWAAGDVQSMFDLYHCQLQNASSYIKVRGEEASEKSLNEARSANLTFVTVMNPAAFVGRGGSNIRQLMSTSATIINYFGERHKHIFTVYHRDADSLKIVQRAANNDDDDDVQRVIGRKRKKRRRR